MPCPRTVLTPAEVAAAQERAPNLKAALLYVAPTFLDQGRVRTRLDWARLWVEFTEVCPDLEVTTELTVESGSWVIGRYTLRGTPVRDLPGMPAGRPFEMTVMDMLRVRDGQIVEYWSVPRLP